MDPKGRRLLERMQQTSEGVTPPRDRGRRNAGPDVIQSRAILDKISIGRASRAQRTEHDRGVPWPPLAAYNDRNGRDGDRDMQKCYRNRQNMMAVFVAFAVTKLLLGLMFQLFTFGE